MKLCFDFTFHYFVICYLRYRSIWVAHRKENVRLNSKSEHSYLCIHANDSSLQSRSTTVEAMSNRGTCLDVNRLLPFPHFGNNQSWTLQIDDWQQSLYMNVIIWNIFAKSWGFIAILIAQHSIATPANDRPWLNSFYQILLCIHLFH